MAKLEEMKVGEVYYCEYCDKELSHDKGEVLHGCLDCCHDIRCERIRFLQSKVDKLLHLLLLTDPLLSNVIVGDTQLKQHQEFLRAFPDEKEKLTALGSVKVER
jgi:hypothetical protein